MVERNLLSVDDSGTVSSVNPRIGDVEPIVMKCDYQLPWNRQSNQTACGETIQTQGGDKNWRVVIEGILSLLQFQEIEALRQEDTVEVVTQEFGKLNVKFDQFNVTRASEEEVGEIDGYVGPLLSFQLQSKEDTQEPLFDDLGPDSN